ncbi:GIY-YIG nuclease family protein [Rhodohalobacter barkolensis]|uniref:GIY-YIG domain-containing protein n=1 Tax=Rhodohalobacter barkolensis TaxID=2053187 RepID=A0A2N0VGJ1_9BACT|nr:hypothetical protein CWD77_11790 [Rhodohalobacter barkolensis]
MSYYVYILYSVSVNRYYVGQMSNLEDRLKRHNQGRSKYTKPCIPWTLKYKERFESRSEVMKIEERIKSLKSRKELHGYIDLEVNELNTR